MKAIKITEENLSKIIATVHPAWELELCFGLIFVHGLGLEILFTEDEFYTLYNVEDGDLSSEWVFATFKLGRISA